MNSLQSAKVQFERDGYFLVKGAYDPQYLQSHVLPFIDEHTNTFAKLEMMQQGAFPVVPPLVKLLMPIVISVKKTGFLQAFLGGDSLYLKMPPNVRYVPPNSPDAMTPMHQDIWDEMPNFVAVWMPCVEIDEHSQGLGLYPSIGFSGPLPTLKHAENVKPVGFRMSPGDALFFHRYMVHSTLPNTSERVRISFDMRIFASTESIPRFYCDLQTGDVKERLAI